MKKENTRAKFKSTVEILFSFIAKTNPIIPITGHMNMVASPIGFSLSKISNLYDGIKPAITIIINPTMKSLKLILFFIVFLSNFIYQNFARFYKKHST